MQAPEVATPSSGLSGTEHPETPQANDGDALGDSSEDYPPTPSTIEDNKNTLSNGKLPEDIPPADNDDIIAKQIQELRLQNLTLRNSETMGMNTAVIKVFRDET